MENIKEENIKKLIKALDKTLAVNILEKKEEELDKEKEESKLNSKSEEFIYRFDNSGKENKISITGLSDKLIEIYEKDSNKDENILSFIRFFLDEITNNKKSSDESKKNDKCEQKNYLKEELEKELNEDDTDSILREILKNYLNDIFKKLSKNEKPSFSLYKALNLISASYYESSSAKGKVLFCSKEIIDRNIDFVIKFSQEKELSKSKIARKLLEISNDKLYLISDTYKIYGFGRIKNIIKLEGKSLLSVEFAGKNHYKLSFLEFNETILKDKIEYYPMERFIVGISEELPKLIDCEYNPEDFKASLIYTFGDKDSYEGLNKILECAVSQKKGTMLVILEPEKAKDEVERLKNYGIQVEGKKLNPKDYEYISAIDGAVIIDTEGKCHGIGFILDGMATKEGSSERGARYNSALKYMNNKEIEKEEKIKVVIVVISEDGMVDIVPDMKKSEEEHNKNIAEIDELIFNRKYKDAIYKVDKIINSDEKFKLFKLEELYFKKAHACYLESRFSDKDKSKIYLDDAFKNYDGVIKLNPINAKVYNNRGVLYKESGEDEKALNDFTKALEIDSKYEMIYNNRGDLYFKMENYKDALSDYNKAIELNPDYTRAYYGRSLVYEKLGETEKASEDLKRYEELIEKSKQDNNNK